MLQIQYALEISLNDIFDFKAENNVYHQSLNDNSVGHQEVQNLYNDNRDVSNKLIKYLENSLEQKTKYILELEEKLGNKF